MHATICETVLVQWCCIDVLSTGGRRVGSVSPGVVVFHRSMVDWRRDIYVHSAIY